MQDSFNLEKICYEKAHIDEVALEIRSNFDKWFDKFLNSENGYIPLADIIERAVDKFSISTLGGKSAKSDKEKMEAIIKLAIDDYKSDQSSYKEIMDLESLDEYQENPSTFKSEVLKKNCPVIRKTLMNKKAKQLDKYRANFVAAKPLDLLNVVTKLCQFADNYVNNDYNEISYESISNVDDLKLGALDTDDGYTAWGVIGGSIKTMLLYKIYPEQFPSRSQNALWALWYLTDKKKFSCRFDSEFLMIDIEKNTTQQNYFYPYSIFSYYAFLIYKMLKSKAQMLNVYYDESYRYVLVDAFLDYIAREHDAEISLLKNTSKEWNDA